MGIFQVKIQKIKMISLNVKLFLKDKIIIEYNEHN